MSKSCYWGLNLSFFLEYLFFFFFEVDGEGLLKVMQLKQLLLSAARFHKVPYCCSCCRCEGQWLLWKEGGSIPCIPSIPCISCSSSCHFPVPCAFSLCSPHPSSSLAQHIAQQLGATLREEASVLHCTMQQGYVLLLHLFFIALSRQILKCHLLWVFD